jgi:hypothetical protein
MISCHSKSSFENLKADNLLIDKEKAIQRLKRMVRLWALYKIKKGSAI